MRHAYFQKMATLSVTTLMMATLLTPAAFAHKNVYYYGNDTYNPPGTAVGRYFNQHPIIKKAAMGAGAGAVLGGLLGSDHWQRSAVKGALIGGLAGSALGYAQQKGYLRGHSSQNTGYYRPQNVYYVQPQTGYYRY